MAGRPKQLREHVALPDRPRGESALCGRRSFGDRSLPFSCALLVAIGLITACGAGDPDPTRDLGSGEMVDDDGKLRWGESTKDRLGVRMPGPVSTEPANMAAGSVPPAADPAAPGRLDYTAPEGWTPLAATSMREVNFLAGDSSVECYVTILGGAAGGPLRNVNRWRDQYGESPITEAQLETMPRVPQLGSEAVLVELDGGDKGMIGTLSFHGDRAVFVKMIGPTELVFNERGRFLSFCGSLRFRG